MAKTLRARRDTSDPNNLWIYSEESEAPKTALLIPAEAERRLAGEAKELMRCVLPEWCDTEDEALALYPKLASELVDDKILRTESKPPAQGARDEAREKAAAFRKSWNTKDAKAALDKEIASVAAELAEAYAGDPAGAFTGGHAGDPARGAPQLRDKFGKRVFARLFAGLPGRAVRELGLSQADLIAAVKAKVPDPEPPSRPSPEPTKLDELLARKLVRKEQHRQALLKRGR